MNLIYILKKRALPIILLAAFFLFFISGLTNAQKIADVSGIWQLEYEGQQTDCQDPNKNSSRKESLIFAVEQERNTISSSFLDNTTTNILAGEIIGYKINITITGFNIEGCKNITFLTGELGKNERHKIKGTYSGKDLSCDTCTWKGEFKAIIIR